MINIENMKITITNKCKEYVLNAENGIKLQIKGYAFLVDNEKILNTAEFDGANLQLKDLYRKNPSKNEELIVFDPTKPSNTDILNRLFDTTFVPSLELKTENGYPFGTYTFSVNQGLDPTKAHGLCCADYDCGGFDAILVIGQRFEENKIYVEELDRSFLAAIITNDDGAFVLNETEPLNQNITWNFTLTECLEDEHGTPQTVDLSANIDEEFINYNASKKDFQTTEIKTDKPLFLVPSSGLSYDDVLDNIIENTNKELGTNYDKVTGDYKDTTIVLADETEKVNNLWNVTPTVTIFDRNDSPIAKPQMLLTYGNEDNDEFTNESIAITYDKHKGLFSLNQVAGIDEIQADIFPENLHEENKFCLDPEYKPYNKTVLSSWSATSGNRRFFKLHSDGGSYDLNGNTFDTFEFNSKGNILKNKTTETTFINSNNNNILSNKSSITDLSLINSNNNQFENVEQSTLIGSNNTTFDTNRNDCEINNHTFIGTDRINSFFTAYDTNNHITFIGNNTYSQFVDLFSGYGGTQDFPIEQNTTVREGQDQYILNLSDIKHIKGKVGVTDYNAKGEIVDYDLGVEYLANINRYYVYNSPGTDPSEFDYRYAQFDPNPKHHNDYASLIGFNGLVVNKNFYNNIIYPGRKYDGYSKSLNTSSWSVSASHTPSEYNPQTATKPNDYTVVFGNYNAITNPYKVKLGYSKPWYIDDSNNTFQWYLQNFVLNKQLIQVNKYVSSVFIKPNSTPDFYEPCKNILDTPAVIYFKNHNDMYFAGAGKNGYNGITADEGDYSLNKIFVVGAGEQYDFNKQTIFDPAENVTKSEGYDSIAKRIDLFSVEQNSFQLVHNNNYDYNPSFSATRIEHLPGMFAVRGWEPVIQKYHYRFTSAINYTTHVPQVSSTLVQSINRHNLQNTIYTPSGLIFPMQRSSNDGYKLSSIHMQDYIKGNTITGITKRINFTELEKKCNEFLDKRYTFVYKTKGVKEEIKGTKGQSSEINWRYKMYIDDIFTGLGKKGIKLKTSGLKGVKSRVYTIYLVNENPKHTLTFKGIRMRKVGANYQTLMATRYIHPGTTQRIMFVDNGSNGEYGVMNFDYFNPNNNTYLTK